MPPSLRLILKIAQTDPQGIAQSYLHSTKYILKELTGTRLFRKRTKLFDYSLHHSRHNGLILEFGVAYGESINHLASLVPNELVYGFDCFAGKPENWGTLPKWTISQ